MIVRAADVPSRDAVVMTETPERAANPHHHTIGGYGAVSKTLTEPSQFGSTEPSSPAHSDHESSPRAASVMTRSLRATDIHRTSCTTAFVTVPGAASQSDRGVSPALPRAHRGDRHRSAARPHRSFGNSLAAAEAGAAATRLAAPLPRHAHVLPPSPPASPLEARSARGAARTDLGRCDSAGARRDAGAAAPAAVRGAGLVAAGRSVRPLARVVGLAHLEPALRKWNAVRALDVDRGRRDRCVVAVGVPRGAAVPVVSALAVAGLGAVAEHIEGVRLEVAA